jgi:Flp pilus assembly protein TadD
VRNRLRLSAISLWLLLALPAGAAAQKDVFVDAFIAFHSALPGAFADEGGQLSAELTRMTAALAAWDRAAAAAEAELKKRSATPGEFALHYVEHQRLELALDAMNSAIAAEPDRAALYNFQGQLLEALGRTAEAIAAFGRARQLDPDDPLAAYFVATRLVGNSPQDLQPLISTLLAAKEQRGAFPERPFADLALIRDLSSRSPVFAPAAYVAAFRAFTARRFHDVADELRAAIARDPLLIDPAAGSNALLDGVAALRAKNGDEALSRLHAAVKAMPESSESRRALGIVYRAMGRLAEAVAQFEIAVRLRSDDERARLALASTLAEAGRLDDAERELRTAIRVVRTSGEARWALAEILDKQRRGAEAIAVLKESVALPVVAGRVHLLWRLAEMSYSYRSDLDHVTALAAQMVRLVPNEAAGHKDLGLAYARAGRDDEGLVELLMTGLLGLEDGETLTAMGQIHFNAGRLELALSTLRRAVALNPKTAQARYALAQTLQRLGRNAEALQELDAFDKLRAAALDEQRRQFEIDNRVTGTAN